MESGYSGTPLPKKLNLPAGGRLLVIGAPESVREKAGIVEFDAEIGIGEYDWMLVHCLSAADLKALFPKLKNALGKKGCLWIAWPKKSSGVATDLGDAVVRETGLATGLVDTKVCAIDETWSGLKFMWRLADR